MENKNNKPAEAVEKPVPAISSAKDSKTAAESVYEAKYLIENHKIFKTSKAIVKIALKQAKKETATLSEAKIIIERFKNKEVK